MATIRINRYFKEFLSLCLKHELRFMVIGGYAVVHYSRPRYTGDIDLWIEKSDDNANRAVSALNDFGFRIDVTPEMFTESDQIVRLGIEPMRLELFTRIPGVTFDDCYPNHVLVELDGLNVPFIGLEDLKKNKRASGRTKDLLDLEELP